MRMSRGARPAGAPAMRKLGHERLSSPFCMVNAPTQVQIDEAACRGRWYTRRCAEHERYASV